MRLRALACVTCLFWSSPALLPLNRMLNAFHYLLRAKIVRILVLLNSLRRHCPQQRLLLFPTSRKDLGCHSINPSRPVGLMTCPLFCLVRILLLVFLRGFPDPCSSTYLGAPLGFLALALLVPMVFPFCQDELRAASSSRSGRAVHVEGLIGKSLQLQM